MPASSRNASIGRFVDGLNDGNTGEPGREKGVRMERAVVTWGAMGATVDTRNLRAVQLAVTEIVRELCPHGRADWVEASFHAAAECFAGRYLDYQPIDARYHDLEHTLQGVLCLARLLLGRRRAGAQPVLTERALQVGVMAMLLHDTGYLKRAGDNQGTGAKYTNTHVARSTEFAAGLMASLGFSPGEIGAAQRMIRCTGLNVNVAQLAFASAEERVLANGVGTADLLGQMAASDYPDKLPILYEEFVEAANFSGGQMPGGGGFTSAQDLMARTPAFWEKYVLVKLSRDFEGLCQYLAEPYPEGLNPYFAKIETNLERIRSTVAPPALA